MSKEGAIRKKKSNEDDLEGGEEKNDGKDKTDTTYEATVSFEADALTASAGVNKNFWRRFLFLVCRLPCAFRLFVVVQQPLQQHPPRLLSSLDSRGHGPEFQAPP